MPLLEIVLWIVAALVIGLGILLIIASIFAFIGAMAMPEDINDDVLGDRNENNRV